MTWRRWNWLGDLLLPAALCLLRVCWLVPLLELVRRWLAPSAPQPLLGLPLMAAFVLGGMALARSAPPRVEELWRARLAVAVAGLGAIGLVLWWRYYQGTYHLWDPRWAGQLATALTHWGDELPAPLVTLLVAAYLWLRGLLDGRDSPNSDHVWQAFAAGLAGFFVTFVAASLDHRGAPAGAVQMVLLHFAAGMVALALCSLQLGRGAVLSGSEGEVEAGRYWLATVAVVIGSLLALGLGLSYVIAPGSITQAFRWVSVVLALLGRVVLYLALALAYIVFLLLTPLINWMQNRVVQQQQPEQGELQGIQKQLEELSRGASTVSPAVADWLRWIGLAALVCLIGAAFALALLKLRKNGAEEADETRETIFSRELLAAQLGEMWRQWLRRVRRSVRAPVAPYLSLEGEEPARRTIRAVYQDMLATASARGLPRLPGQTPLEYGRKLGEAVPGGVGSLATITERYHLARYGPDLPTEAQASEAVRAWNDLQARLAAESEPDAPGDGQGANDAGPLAG